MKTGATLAFFMGIFYFIFMLIMGWESGWGWAIIAIILAASVVAALTTFFPPKYLLVYPGMFSLATLLFGMLMLISGNQPTRVVGTWLGIAVAINVVGYCGGYIVYKIIGERLKKSRSDPID